jgi:apolipoprotein N-acyltransferase
MKLLDVILFGLVVVSFIIGVDQAIIYGLAESYWIFMFSLVLLFLYGYRKGQRQAQEKKSLKKTSKKQKNRKHG